MDRGGYHMTRWSLCVVSTTVYSPGLPIYTVNLISPISTALRRPHDAIYTGRAPLLLSRTHTPAGLPSSLDHRRGNISRGRARRFRGVEYIARRRRTCGEVVREVTMFPVIRRCCFRKFGTGIITSFSVHFLAQRVLSSLNPSCNRLTGDSTTTVESERGCAIDQIPLCRAIDNHFENQFPVVGTWRRHLSEL